jgi:CDP-glucose 4,6-dehydratase
MDVSNSFWLDRPVLVTGATGLLGGWLVKYLLDLNATVVCLVRDWVPQSEIIRKGLINDIRTVRGDVRNQKLLERVMGEYEINTVFHLAAQTIVSIANRNPISTFETNIAGTYRLLEACRRSPAIKSVVLASSDKAYGNQKILPYEEGAPLQGSHPYDVSKSCADLIGRTYAKTHGLPVCITRCGNFYGGGDLNWNRIVPGTIRSIVRGERPIIRSDGQYIRDYIYIEDAVCAYLSLAEQLNQNKSLAGEAFNFSNDKPTSVLALVKLISALMNFKQEPLVLNEASNEIRDQYLKSKKAHEILGWSPKFQLEDGLKLTIKWYEDFLKAK